MRKGLQKVLATAVAAAMLCSFPVTANADSSVPGDITGDGAVDMADSMRLYQYTSGRRTMTAAQRAKADVNYDGTVDNADTLGHFQRVSGSSEWEETEQGFYVDYRTLSADTATMPEIQIVSTQQEYRVLPQIGGIHASFNPGVYLSFVICKGSMAVICPAETGRMYTVSKVTRANDVLHVSLTWTRDSSKDRTAILLTPGSKALEECTIQLHYTEDTSVIPLDTTQTAYVQSNSAMLIPGETVSVIEDKEKLKAVATGMERLGFADGYDEAFFEENVLIVSSHTQPWRSATPFVTTAQITDDTVLLTRTETATGGFTAMTGEHCFIPVSRTLYHGQAVVTCMARG